MNAPVFPLAPARVYWELTRACDLACRHCRALAAPDRSADELTTAECLAVLHDLAAAGPPASAGGAHGGPASPAPAGAPRGRPAARPGGPHVVFTGGDPLKRPDLTTLVTAASGLGLGPALAPSATVAITRESVHDLAGAGVSAMSLSLDGPTAAQHDGIRGVLGCFGWTLTAAHHIVKAGIPLQINTLVAAETEPHLEEIAKLVARLGAARWSLFFLIAVGRGRVLRPLGSQECEQRLRWLAERAPTWPFTVSTTEAPHFRRVVIQSMVAAGRSAAEIAASPAARAFGIRDGNGIMFIAANGDVTPSGFLPLVVGNARQESPIHLYRDAPLFRALREPNSLTGRCGACAYRVVCGGSRARAWASSGDPLGEDPLCPWNTAAAA